MTCPAGFTADTIAVHQRDPVDTDRLIFTCAASGP
jgi:hypothetical protein